MKAFILDRYGKKQALRLGDRPEPVPGPDDVLVEVEAALSRERWPSARF
jgi:NADPH:quinone reductase-like Zn-dependent oxidoreductase